MAESSEPVEKTDHSKEAANEERLSPAELKAFLSERYLTPYHQLPPPWLSTQITHWDENPLLDLARQESINEFLHTQPSPMTTHLEFVFAGLEGDVVDCVVSERPPGSCLTSKTSSSVIRQPANYTSDFIRGRSGRQSHPVQLDPVYVSSSNNDWRRKTRAEYQRFARRHGSNRYRIDVLLATHNTVDQCHASNQTSPPTRRIEAGLAHVVDVNQELANFQFVVFDEVHYINDSEQRPEHKEFADWVGYDQPPHLNAHLTFSDFMPIHPRRTKQKDIYVISTPKRPVPLEHFLYANKEIHKIVDAKGEFLSQGQTKSHSEDSNAAGATSGAEEGFTVFHHLASAMGRVEGRPNSGRVIKKTRIDGTSGWNVEEKGITAGRGFHFLKETEKSEIHVVIERSLTRLNGTDRYCHKLSECGTCLLVESEFIMVVEILFSRGLVKILFATETFAMGVNMPARCVVFSGIQKHDGRSYRELLSGEYTQMSGRAGRRGLDSTGVVIIICGNEVPDTVGLHKMILGPATKLQSQFRLTYNMVLNLLRVEALRVEEMIKSSFSENAQQRLLPEQQKKILEVERELQALPIQDDTDIIQDTRRYHEVSTRLVELNSQLVKFVVKHPSGSRALCSGRLAAILKPAQSLRANPGGRLDHTPSYFVLAFVPPDIRAGTNDIAADEVPPAWPPLIQPTTSDLTYELAVVPITSISMLTKHTLSLNVNEIADQHRKSHMVEALNQLVSSGILDELARTPRNQLLSQFEVEHPKLRSLEFRDLLSRRTQDYALWEALSYVEKDEQFEKLYAAIHRERIITNRLALLQASLSEQNLELLPDYENRLEVLKELKFIDDRATVLLKGRVACEINSSHELILTEVILDNIMADFDPAETVALLSSFVFQGKTESEPLLTPNLQQGCDRLAKIADRIEAVSLRNKVAEHDQASSGKGRPNFGMVELVWQWAQGMPFSELMEMSEIQEGVIVRTMTRLDESCREVRDAARIIGDISLGKKMEACQALIRRDVVFVSSLYI
ncbi:hypothetical protein KEM48_005026 [Puccinia striiformis f. sp. tritici PST-130]|nr:hypothetical protein KEM48_005026 [Puccinia striiformis f. sp. tritici PST-130]